MWSFVAPCAGCWTCAVISTELCRSAAYPSLTNRVFRMMGTLHSAPSSVDWKVVGWIESFNDLLYFVDILGQVRQNDLQHCNNSAEFKEKFYEHGYADEIFCRTRTPEPRRLLSRLTGLCRRWRGSGSESLCLAPRLRLQWVAMQPRRRVSTYPHATSARCWSKSRIAWICVIGTTTWVVERLQPETALTRKSSESFVRGRLASTCSSASNPLCHGRFSEVWIRSHWRRIDSYHLETCGCARFSPWADSGIQEGEAPVAVRPDEVRSGRPHAAHAGSDRMGVTKITKLLSC